MANKTESNSIKDVLAQSIKDILELLPQDREREIISRRFGLFDRKETLEQIGDMLGITRERVRQLEKAILIKLKMAVEGDNIQSIQDIDKNIIRDLSENGRVSRVDAVAARLLGANPSREEVSQIAFISELSPKLTLVNENDNFYNVVGIKQYGDEAKIKKEATEAVKIIKKQGEPVSVDKLTDLLGYEHPSHAAGIASVSKQLAELNGMWGLTKWPTVNPKNIRDKIYVILAENGKPMHFSEIAEAIKASDFKRKNVTKQAIHNELIKDGRFVLIGRGIYALDSWGYSKGTVGDVINEVLKEAGEPLHRDEIVRRVLAKRQVKETTVLLNLQSRQQFKRVAKATYELATPEAATK